MNLQVVFLLLSTFGLGQSFLVPRPSGHLKTQTTGFFPTLSSNQRNCQTLVTIKAGAGDTDGDDEEPDWDALRAKLSEMTGFTPKAPINVIPAQQGDVADNEERVEYWEGEFGPGMVLVANPRYYLQDETPDRDILSKFGFEGYVPPQFPGDKKADLLPVVLVVENSEKGTVGFLLNRRTGYLCGDLGEEEEGLKAFMIQPIWMGGTTGAQGLGFIHSYGDVTHARQITEDGLYYGGDLKSAAHKVTEGTGTGFNFRFFLQFTTWGPKQMEEQVAKGMWYPVKCSKMSILKARDRAGPYKCPPMWTDLLIKLGKPYDKIVDFVYDYQ